MCICLILSLVGFGVSVIGIKFSSNNLKQLMAWSSVRNMRMLFVLVTLNNSLGLVYYLFYTLLVIVFCSILHAYKGNLICVSLVRGKERSYQSLVGIFLLVFSGLPPFIRFFLKVYFLRGFYLFDCIGMLLDIEYNGVEISFFFLLARALNR